MQNNLYLCGRFILTQTILFYNTMKKAFLMVLMGGMLMACHSDIDLKNVDTTAQLEMGVAVPVGSIRAQLGDFVGQIQGLYVDSANGGVITFRFGFPDERNYHQFDLAQHVSKRDTTLNVYEKLEAAHLIGPNGKITGTGYPVTLHFDLPIKLNGINKDMSKERLDSALIENAKFTSVINQKNLPLDWDWIDRVDLVLGSSVYRPAGNTKTIYRKGDEGGYGQQIDTEVDDFSINLMKNRNLSIEKNSILEYAANVDSVITFGVDFTFTVPAGVEREVPTGASFKYHMEVAFIDYKAIWGYFDPDPDMISKQVEVDISKELGELSFLQRASTPFTDPRIDVAVTTKIAGAMTLRGKNVYVIGIDGDSTFATFNGKRERIFHMEPWMHPDPTKPGSAIGEAVTDTVPFSKAEAEGRIDRLFGKIPQKLGYDFYVDFDAGLTPQIRITPDTKVAINAVCTLPLKFRDSLFIDYSDTIKDINLSAVNIDSLVRQSQVIDSLRAGEVTLYITALSEIPMTVKGVFEYLDKNGQPIKDPTDPSKLFNPFLEDTIRIVPPRFEKNAMGQWVPVESGKSIFTAQMSKEKLAVVPDIKRIVYKVIVDNEALNYAFKANPGLKEAPLTSEQHLELNIGLTAQIDAIMNFNSKK